jgi:hypothetical protein
MTNSTTKDLMKCVETISCTYSTQGSSGVHTEGSVGIRGFYNMNGRN